jgi:phage gp29-like protein
LSVTELREVSLPNDAPVKFQAEVIPTSDRHVSHPGKKLTASKISGAYSSAENGYPEVQCDIFDDRIEVDGHLRDALEGRVESVARKKWNIAPGGESLADEIAAQKLEEAIRKVSNWRLTLEHLLKANWYGYGYAEIDWQRRNGLTVPVYFENVHARRFNFDVATDLPLLRTEDNFSGVPLTPGKWWSIERSGRKKATAGLMRTAAWWSMFKVMSTRDWLVWANRYGLPYAYAQIDPHLRPEDRETVKQMMRTLGQDGWAVFQQGVEVTIKEATKTGGSEEVHGALVRLCNSEMSKLIHGATLVSENQGPGSFAATREHGTRAFQRIAGDAEMLGETFMNHVGLPFVHYNGIPAKPPVLMIHVVRDTDPINRAKLYSIAVNELGMKVKADQAYQEFQLKRAENDEDALPGGEADKRETTP